MTLDHWLLVLLGFSLLYRYHRNALAKAEERFEKCDKERVQLHNFFYGREGVALTDVGNEEPLAAEKPMTQDDSIRERIEQTKLELKRFMKRRPSHLGPALRRIEHQKRPSLSKIRPAMDPATAAQVKQKIADEFAQIGEQVREKVNGRPTHAGG